LFFAKEKKPSQKTKIQGIISVFFADYDIFFADFETTLEDNNPVLTI